MSVRPSGRGRLRVLGVRLGLNGGSCDVLTDSRGVQSAGVCAEAVVTGRFPPLRGVCHPEGALSLLPGECCDECVSICHVFP